MRREVGPGLANDDDWRDLVERMTGQRSTRGLTDAQATGLIDELDRLRAGKRASKGGRKALEGPYAKKLQALWIGCWNLGLVETSDDAAMIAFARRQTGIDHANWVRDHVDAVAVIEALKSMMGRAGVDWAPIGRFDPPWTNRPGFRIAAAQWRAVSHLPWFKGFTFGSYVAEMTGRIPEDCDDRAWIVVMNGLGRRVRAAKAA